MATANEVSDEAVGICFSQGDEPVMLPCPFCGGTKLDFSQLQQSYFVECNNSKCPGQPMVMGKDVLADAIDKWNSRNNDEMAAEAYTLRWLRDEAKEAGWDLLDLVEAALDKKLAKIMAIEKAPPIRFED